MNDNFDRIKQAEKYEDGWDGRDGKAPSQVSLVTAKKFIDCISKFKIADKIQFSVDCLGRIGFASYQEYFYLDLTIENDSYLTWYATIGKEDKDYFHIMKYFDGEHLPEKLYQLLFFVSNFDPKVYIYLE